MIAIIIIIVIMIIIIIVIIMTIIIVIIIIIIIFFIITWLITETNGLAQKKKNVFYFLIKIPNVNLYWNKNGKSVFPKCIDRLGHQKRETKQQHPWLGKYLTVNITQ